MGKEGLRRKLGELGLGQGASPNGNLVCDLTGFWPRPIIKLAKHLDYEYQLGLPWYLKNIHGTKILDIGFAGHSELTEILGGLGFEAYGVDIVEAKVEKVIPVYCLAWELPKGLDGFDTIIANSFFEHIGLGFYDRSEPKDATDICIKKFRSILSPEGRLLLQVPYGKDSVLIRWRGRDFYKTFTHTSLEALLEDFILESQIYFAKASKGWIEVSKAVADKVQQGGGFPSCLTYVKARK